MLAQHTAVKAAGVDAIEVLEEVFKGHPELAVIGIGLKADLALDAISPKGRVVCRITSVNRVITSCAIKRFAIHKQCA